MLTAKHPEAATLLAQARAAMEAYQYQEVVSFCETALAQSRISLNEQAELCCLLAEALEVFWKQEEAWAALKMYESIETRQSLPDDLHAQILLQMANVIRRTNCAKAIYYGQQALALADSLQSALFIGKAHIVIGRTYIYLSETPLAREHLLKAVSILRALNEKRWLAWSFHLLGSVNLKEGNLTIALQQNDHALSIVANVDSYARTAFLAEAVPIIGFQGYITKGVTAARWLLDNTAKSLSTLSHNVMQVALGYCLSRSGEPQQAKDILQVAITTAKSIKDVAAEGTALDSIGEIELIQGNEPKAEAIILKSIKILSASKHRHAEQQVFITSGWLHLQAGRIDDAEKAFFTSLEITNHYHDQLGQSTAYLWLTEAKLAANDSRAAAEFLAIAQKKIAALMNPGLMAHAWEMEGKLALCQAAENGKTQQQELLQKAGYVLRQAVRLNDFLGNRLRQSHAHYHLARAYAQAGDVATARQELAHATAIFQKMEARPMLERARQLQDQLGAQKKSRTTKPGTVPRAVASGVTRYDLTEIMQRLTDAAFASDFLCHEFAHILHHDFGAQTAIVFTQAEDGSFTVFAHSGCTPDEAQHWCEQFAQAGTANLLSLYHWSGEKFWLYVADPAARVPNATLENLRKQVEVGLAAYHWQLHLQESEDEHFDNGGAHESLPQSIAEVGLVYSSPAMHKVVRKIQQLRSSNITVLISGESGTGKELIARALHRLSPRAEQSFAAFNCAAVPSELIESQLFGHRRGAFTNAHTDSLGIIRQAENGTLLLDEIGELPLTAQPKLLRFLQEGEIQTVGESKTRPVNVRVIAATNRNLEQMVAEGKFREDLYYRLNIVNLHLPPLRERRAEIPILLHHFLELLSRNAGKEKPAFEAQAFDLLLVYDWPGNVRQLYNEVARLVALAPPIDAKITVQDLSPVIVGKALHHNLSPSLTNHTAPQPAEPALTLAALERQTIIAALAHHHHNITQTAKALGVTPQGLRKKIKRLDIRA